MFVLFTGADAVHTTCYEQKSKVMGLKVSNLFNFVLLLFKAITFATNLLHMNVLH